MRCAPHLQVMSEGISALALGRTLKCQCQGSLGLKALVLGWVMAHHMMALGWAKVYHILAQGWEICLSLPQAELLRC